MAISLREKLRSAVPIEKKTVNPTPSDCFIRTSCYPLSAFDLAKCLPESTLTLVQGSFIPDMPREKILFLDTETTGLSGGAGTVAFLVGVGYFEEERFVTEQYLMRDYDEEVYVLSHTAARMEDCEMVCTFNGATFDLPLLSSRFIMNRMRPKSAAYSLDLLHASRRVWKLRLHRCNLTCLEEAILGQKRQDDLPGSLVPERYFAFLKNRDMTLLDDILKHNEQDIVSLVHILSKLLSLHEAPLLANQPEDVYSLGRIMEKRGKGDMARRCFRAANQGTVSLLSQTCLAESYRRNGEIEKSVQTYEELLSGHRGNVQAHVALAKMYEHRLKDLPSAMEHTRIALSLCAQREDAMLPLLQKRYERIMKKTRRM